MREPSQVVVPVFLICTIYTISWYYTSSKNAVATQRLVQGYKYKGSTSSNASSSGIQFDHFPEMTVLTALQLFTGLCISWIIHYLLSLQVKGPSARTIPSPLLSPVIWNTKTGIAVGILHYVGCFCTNMGFALGSASVVQVIKLLEPIETLILTALTNFMILNVGAGHGITVTRVVATITIITGTAMLLTQKSRVAEDANDDINRNPVNYHSVFFALCSGFAMASRNVIKKMLLPKEALLPHSKINTGNNNGQIPADSDKDDNVVTSRHVPVWIQSTLKGLSNYFSITAVAAVPATLCFLLAEMNGSTSPLINKNNMLISAWMLNSKAVGSAGKEAIVFHGLYNLSSISVLGLISAQLHSILNVGKRIVNVLAACIAFQEPIGFHGIVGLCIAAMGGMFYSFGGNNGNGDYFPVLFLQPAFSTMMSTKKVLSRYPRRKRYFVFLISICLMSSIQIFLGSSVNSNGYVSQTMKHALGIAESKYNQRGYRKYVVWMFPFPPPASYSGGIVSSELICAYSNACKDVEDHAKINLRELTQGTYYHNYIRDQAYHKVRHMNDFPYHIQAITMLALMLDNSDQKGGNVCVRTLGGRTEFCDNEAFSSYDPYEGNELNETHFPYEFFNDDPVSVNSTLSLAPRVMLTTEKFAMWYNGDISKDDCKYYNSGEDVQSFAGAAWLPFISELRKKRDVLRNYNGYYIGNALMEGFFNVKDADFSYEKMKKITLTSIYLGADSARNGYSYLMNYTNSVDVFGSRSTKTDSQLKGMKIKSYFSACLTLTTDMQGAILTNDASLLKRHRYVFNDILKPNATKLPSSEEKTKIVFVDVVDISAVPKSVRESENAIYLRANMNADYPGCDETLPRYGYPYKLLSTYANQAKVVITSRIHAALPAAAMGVPVIFVENSGGRKQWLPGGKQGVGRVEGLLDMFHRVRREDNGKNWTLGDLTGDVPHSDGVHLADRYRASFWNKLKKTHYYRDSAKMFGMVPFQRLGRNNIEINIQDTFHFVLEKSDLTWQTKRAIEHVFYFHPNCKVYIHSNDIGPPHALETLTEAGYNLVVQTYDLDLLHTEVLGDLPHKSHNNDFKLEVILPLILLRKMGGIYLSKETIVLKTISAGIEEGVVLQENGDIAMAYYDRESKDLLSSLQRIYIAKSKSIAETRHNLTWSFPVLSDVHTLQCIEDIKWGLGDDTKDKIAVGLHPSTYAAINTIKFETECYKIVEQLCIFCDEIHWGFNE